MRLDELFGDKGAIDHFRNVVLDYLTPLAAANIEKVDMSDLEEVMHLDDSGIIIDRTLMMKVLDPNELKMVKKIEGDTVYISFPVDEISAKTEEDEEKDKQNIKKKAGNEAMKAVKK